MPYQRRIAAIALATALSMTFADAQAADESRYPDLNGQWSRAHPRSQWDPSKPRGLQQQAPLTPEYHAIFEANLAGLHAGNLGADPQVYCLPTGMPRMMIAYEPMEIIVLPEVTYILIDHINESHRRIYTDGRDWPGDVEPAYVGYSIGKWADEDGDGRYDALEAETRHIKGPRAYDATGLPLHRDNQTVVKERIYLDKANPNMLRDDITVIDNALTRPWIVTKSYRRNPNPRPEWQEYVCAESNNHVQIGKESYFMSADGYLMPAKKDQPPPDLKYFNRTRK